MLFPTAGCRPKLDFLDCLKAIAERAKLDADGFWLHKFRATFATRCLWAGVDLRTVQLWLGHSDMEFTMRYLKPSRSQAALGEDERDFRLSVVIISHCEASNLHWVIRRSRKVCESYTRWPSKSCRMHRVDRRRVWSQSNYHRRTHEEPPRL